MKFTFRQKRLNRLVHVKNAVVSALNDCDLYKEISFNSIRDNWDGIVNTLIASHTMPDRIFKNILFIASDHPVYSNELMMMKNDIINILKNDYGYFDIRDIRVEVKRLRF